MSQQAFNKEKLTKYWVQSSDEDYDTMEAMFGSKRYSWSLFVGHLMIEKLLKAYFVKVHEDYPPFIHNLVRLAESCEIKLNDKDKLFLATVTAFNINARYDDYKMSFQKKCTPEYTDQWIQSLRLKRQWIKKLIEA